MNLKIVVFILVAGFDFANGQESTGAGSHPFRGTDIPGLAAMETITAAAIERHTRFLGSDVLEGRATGSAGGQAAASYIVEQLEGMGFTFPANHNSFYQPILMHGSICLAESQFRIYEGENLLADLALGNDYLLYKSGAQTFIPTPLPLVFVGYGIVAPEFDYNDYQSVDVEGKIVVFLSGEPHSEDPNYFTGVNPTIYSLPEAKQRLAISRGASGSILIPVFTENPAKSWKKLGREFSFEDVTLAYSVTGHLSAMVNTGSAALFFRNSPRSLDDILKLDREGHIESFPLNVRVSFKGEFIERDFFSENIIAFLEGGDPQLKDSYLLISAHYDHLGIGPAIDGDTIYNGVFDNAAGVSAALEIARAFTLAAPPKRSIIFLFLTGEEKGLLGSQHYIDHPAAPLYKTVANVNIDGLAMFDTFNDVVGVGSELSTLEDFLRQTTEKTGLTVSPLPPEFRAAESFARSDQITFAKAGIPAILTMPGLDLKHTPREAALQQILDWNDLIYHSPFDDLSQPINYSASEQHARFLFALCYDIANSSNAPKWKPEAPFITARLQSQAEKR